MPKKISNHYKLIILILIIAAFSLQSANFAFSNDSEKINQEIKGINSDIQNKKREIDKFKQRQEAYLREIKIKQGEKSSLNNQLAILDNRMAKAELDIELVEADIERVKLEMQKTDLAIEGKNKEIEREKDHIATTLDLMNRNDNVSSLEVLLLNDSLADFLSQAKYLEDINRKIKESLGNLEKLKKQLEKEKVSLSGQNEELDKLREELVKNKKVLASEKESKVFILSQVSQSEKEYQNLLSQAKKEQEDAASEIAVMEKIVRAKLASMEEKKLEFNDSGFIWPVPKNVVTAYFHDPSYPFRNIFEHPAVDIRAGQGTTLKAAASGYVARTVTGGSKGYGYIMIIHGNGLSTVYGHVSKIYVKEDDYVVQGQKIGLTGGLPGTPGAGRLTTGPHLHFEVRLNGIPVNPLNYLP
jgi:murein DD-endopeptidase MepM/ murein hydrolase activator NlpD